METPKRKEPENQQFLVSDLIRNLLYAYDDHRNLTTASTKFAERLGHVLATIDGEKPSEAELSAFIPKFGIRKLMSGETLRRDGGFTEQALAMDRRMTMVEMEAAGFAFACQETGVDWAVFRGGCDHADPEKDDVWQRVAALNSALTVCDCLEAFTGLRRRRPTEPVETAADFQRVQMGIAACQASRRRLGKFGTKAERPLLARSGPS